MKTERRQELKTNDLGAFLVETNDWVRKNAYQLGSAVGVVLLAVIVVLYVRGSRTRSIENSWQKMSELSFEIDKAEESFKTLDRLIAETDDRDFKMSALLLEGSNARSLVSRLDGFHPEFIDAARRAYQALLDAYADRPDVQATALSGLAFVEENLFVLDGDIAHKQRARAYLERLTNDPRFKGTPFQTLAAQRLLDLDETFRVVSLADPLPLPPAPPPSAPPATAPTSLKDAAGAASGTAPAPPPVDATGSDAPAPEQPAARSSAAGTSAGSAQGEASDEPGGGSAAPSDAPNAPATGKDEGDTSTASSDGASPQQP